MPSFPAGIDTVHARRCSLRNSTMTTNTEATITELRTTLLLVSLSNSVVNKYLYLNLFGRFSVAVEEIGLQCMPTNTLPNRPTLTKHKISVKPRSSLKINHNSVYIEIVYRSSTSIKRDNPDEFEHIELQQVDESDN